MESILVLLLLPIVILVIISFIRKERTRKPPGPRGLPIIGNLHQLKEPLHENFWRLSRKYGPLLYMKLGSRSVLVANSSRMAQEILKIQDINFCSRPAKLCFRKMTYELLDIAFSPYSEYWREMRKVCVLHLLSAKRVQSFRPIREDEVSRMVQKINQKASSFDMINMSDMITSLTSTIICRVAFGIRYEQDSDESKRFNHLIDEFQVAHNDFYFSDYFPLIGWLHDKLTGKIDNLDRICMEWDSFYQQLIDEHLHPDRPKSTNDDIIDILLKLREEGLGPSYGHNMDHIKAIIMNIYFASADTIATTTIWTMTTLIKYPAVMKKAQEEIRTLLSLRNKKMVEEEDIVVVGLPYLNAVIKEATRKHTTTPLLMPRETIEKCTIDGFEIPAKTLVYVNVWAVGNDPLLWENPEDFMPERFLDDERKLSIDLKGQDFELMPFGVGRRGCPGITMALATMQLVLANLLYLFDWDLPNGMKKEDVDIEILPGMIVHKKSPLCVVARKYANSN
ncbi:hypothetical protein RD792_014385 [Penstemon davidsonii]|uniref:Cytochrome P450 n=1 Tax=Penstemon davidsonii TaxID=160366 RepID=A0ABR0CP71_9LAMI|nr:hypothetical protein RD792_014385 [Penstemon davidsonii]